MTEITIDTPKLNNSFWDSLFGKILRWAAFIPVGSILLLIIEIIIISIFSWLFSNHWATLWFIFIGAFLPLSYASVFIYYSSIRLITTIICPKPKLGILVFGSIYMVFNLLTNILNISDGRWSLVFTRLILNIIAIISFIVIYGKQKEYEIE